jgi:aspartyl-tRNA(Asn)/glutamyl-tRNA(Gln) amidotransferase subunit A
MKGLPQISIRRVGQLMAEGKLSSKELCSYCYTLSLAGENVWKLSAFLRLLDRDTLMEQAEASDARWKTNRPLSLLDGIPVTIKANLALETQPLTAGSRILGASAAVPSHVTSDGTPPVGYTADAVQRLIDGGAIILGVTSMDEFGMGSLGTNTASGIPTKNPLPLLRRLGRRTQDSGKSSFLDLVSLSEEAIMEAHAAVLSEDDHGFSAGGSSCGSSVSVAHGSSLLSLGSDTGGSVRLPAAWCGVVGLKPTYGHISRHGLVSYASSLDTIGIMGPTADCVSIGLQQIVNNQRRDRDSTLVPLPYVRSIAENLDSSLALDGIKIGIPAAFSVAELPDNVRDAWSASADHLASHGATVEIVGSDAISPDTLQRALAAYYIIASAEAGSNLSRYDGFRYGVSAEVKCNTMNNPQSMLERQYATSRSYGFGSEVVRRVLCGTAVLSADRFHTYYESAAELRAFLTEQFEKATEQYDVLLVPTVAFPPAPLDRTTNSTQTLANDAMTVPISLTGLPAVSVPFERPTSQLFPPSMQLIGPRFGEEKLLKVAALLNT